MLTSISSRHRGPLAEAASLRDYPAVARLSGTVWIELPNRIVSMPVVTDRVKRPMRRRGKRRCVDTEDRH